VTWQEPDYLNILGVCKDDVSTIINQNKIDEQLRILFKSFGNELFNREILYYRHLLMDEITDDEFNKVITKLIHFDEKYKIADKITTHTKNESKEGFAVLENKTERFCITKTCTIIGKQKRSQKLNVTWDVDIDLGHHSKISKQHALILYNFQIAKFEVKCLSSKHSIEVNGIALALSDPPVAIDNGSSIQIGNITYHFFNAKDNKKQ